MSEQRYWLQLYDHEMDMDMPFPRLWGAEGDKDENWEAWTMLVTTSIPPWIAVMKLRGKKGTRGRWFLCADDLREFADKDLRKWEK